MALTTGYLARAPPGSRRTSPVGRAKTNQAKLEPERTAPARGDRETPVRKVREDPGWPGRRRVPPVAVRALRVPPKETTANSTTTIMIKARQARTTGKGISAWPTRRTPATRPDPADPADRAELPRAQVKTHTVRAPALMLGGIARLTVGIETKVRLELTTGKGASVWPTPRTPATKAGMVRVKTGVARARALTAPVVPPGPRAGFVVLAPWHASGF